MNRSGRGSKTASKNFYSVVHQIKKSTIVNKLYGGKCVGCEQITTQNNLPTLQFHHRDVNDDKSKLWLKIQYYELKQIKNELIKKNCVSLCGNCHQMIHSTNFKTQHEEIISSEHWGQVKTYFNTLEKNVRNFKFPKDIDKELTIKPKINQKKEKNNAKRAKEERINVINITQQKDVGEYLKIIRNKDPINLKVDVDGEFTLKQSNVKEIIRSMKVAKEENNIAKNFIHQKEFNENIKSEKDSINWNLENNRNLPKPLNINDLEKLQNIEYGIAKLSEEKTIIRTKDIADSVGVITRNVRKNLVKLVNKEFVIISSENNDRHILISDLGLEELHKIKKLKGK
jgi:hypothetical protein